MDAKISKEVAEKVERRWRASAEISDRVSAAIDVLPPLALGKILRLYVDEVDYLGEHLPGERENVTAHPCSDETWHFCSFSSMHATAQTLRTNGGGGWKPRINTSRARRSLATRIFESEIWGGESAIQCSGGLRSFAVSRLKHDTYGETNLTRAKSIAK